VAGHIINGNNELGLLSLNRPDNNPVMKKIVIAGGSGFVGRSLAAHFSKTSDVVILSRAASKDIGNVKTVKWDAVDAGEWTAELEGAYALINLTGKNVNCRYTADNKKEILESRTLSTRALGEAVKKLKNQPKVWIQMSSATIYRHSDDKPMDETHGEIGDDFSMGVCQAWEKIFSDLELPGVRKVIMRLSIVLSHGGGAFPSMLNLVKFGLGGRQGSGKQMVSWIHEKDVVAVIEWMLNGEAKGVYNVTAPQPVSNEKFMRTLRETYGAWFGLPSPVWLLNFGAKLIGTETELVLKSRWVIPKRLLQEGYRFQFTSVEAASNDLA